MCAFGSVSVLGGTYQVTKRSYNVLYSIFFFFFLQEVISVFGGIHVEENCGLLSVLASGMYITLTCMWNVCIRDLLYRRLLSVLALWGIKRSACMPPQCVVLEIHWRIVFF